MKTLIHFKYLLKIFNCALGIQRQKVKYATKLFSHTVSKAISRLGMLGFYTAENWSECSDFFKIVNDWFDVFNSQIPHPDSRGRVKG